MLREWHSEIHRVRLTGDNVGAPSPRIFLDGLMGNTTLSPSGMPHEAVLISKAIRCNWKTSGGLAPGKQMSDWQWQVNQALEVSHQNAVRYLNGRCVISGADSVIFGCVAESLACFICDIAFGQAGTQWWWKSYLRKYPVSPDRFTAIVTVINDNLIFLPQIVDYLSRWRLLPSVFGGISDSACQDLIENFLAFYNIDIKTNISQLNELLELLVETPEDLSNNKVTAVDNVRSTEPAIDEKIEDVSDGFVARPVATEDSPSDPVSGPVSPASLPWISQPDAACLLEALHRVINHGSYRKYFDREWEKISDWSSNQSDLSFAQRNLIGVAYLTGRDIAVGKSNHLKSVFSILTNPLMKAAFPNLQQAVHRKWLSFGVTEKPFSPVNVYTEKASIAPLKNALVGEIYESRQDSKKDKLAQNEEVVGVAPEDASSVFITNYQVSPSVKSTPLAAVSGQRQWTTNYGGALYLFNLLRFLDLQDVVSNSNNTDDFLSLWAWLEMLTRYLLAEESDADDDEIWKALALLDEREPGEVIGIGVHLEGGFIVPQQWKDFLGCSETAELNGNEKDTIASAVDGIITNPSLFDLLEKLLPLMKQCLTRATGEKSESIVDELLRCRGHISITRTHVDFYTSLDNISLAARRAGLDRNPGWCPEVGKVVQFHFE